jgi:predicted O-methyltransferase YrrM
VTAGILRPIARAALRSLGLRPPDYKRRVRHGEVCMDNVELHGLVRAVRALDRPPEMIVEIGSYCGGSTVVLGRAAIRRTPTAQVFAIDPFHAPGDRYQRPYEQDFDANVAEWGLARTIQKLRMTSQDASKEWRRPIDLLYVDGDHGYEAVKFDIQLYVPLVRPGGLLLFHDYKLVGKDGVRQAIDELVLPRHDLMFRAGSVICFRKSVA